MQAVILAAGLGSRLKDRTTHKAKGFLKLDNMAIVERSVQKLIEAGIDSIIIGTGHCSGQYDNLAKKYSIIKTIKNEDYANTASMATLKICSQIINDDFILLESDLIYDSIGLFVLLNDARKNVVLASGFTQSGDEVYIEADKDNRLINVSKNKKELSSIYGELVGITKLSAGALKNMCDYADKNENLKSNLDYEKVLAAVSRDCKDIFVRKIERYVWREIDDENHLKTAEDIIMPQILENESLRKVKREVLLNPGPATTTDSVKYAQVCPDICPREKEFGDTMRWICDELSIIAGGRQDNIETVLFGGSGTAADEIMISSCIPDDGKLLIVDNGAYGARLANIASVYNVDFDVYKSSGFMPLDVKTIKSQLLSGGGYSSRRYTHFAIVYHETTTGLLNPVAELCKFCHEHDIVTIVDAVSAYAAIPIDMDKDCIDFMASTSNKNIQGVAGLCFVFCRAAALEEIKNYKMRNYYLNLWEQYAYFKKTKQMRFTPPVQTIYALKQAIIEAKIET
ncbi:MAG: aminotransferase class V-fold PLP-dependent enzyme, partial [Elusimicrobiota bacterium]|nr:aminotransferase class V-fold PLP-dependent enzyme [Elusimicrobiota bacterium]